MGLGILAQRYLAALGGRLVLPQQAPEASQAGTATSAAQTDGDKLTITDENGVPTAIRINKRKGIVEYYDRGWRELRPT